MSDERPPRTSAPSRAPSGSPICVLLAPAMVVPLLVPLYDPTDPTLFGFPFYFWFQLALIPCAVVLTVTAYYLAQGSPTGVTVRPRDGGGAAMRRRQHGHLQRLHLPVPARHRARLRRRPLAPGQGPGQPRRVGPRRPRLRHVHRLVPHRRRPLHGVHVHRRARDAVRRQRGRLLRRAVHDRRLPDDLPVPAAALVGSHRHGYVTPADFVQGRYDSRPLALAIALTGILATMPYIALQLVGIEVVLAGDGHQAGEDASWFVEHLPLFIAFAVLAAYTYSSRPARAGADRVREGHPDLHRDHRGGASTCRRARRLGLASSAPRPTRSPRSTTRTPTRSRPARPRRRRMIPPAAAALGLRLPGAGLGAGAVHVPALGHRRALHPRAAR